MSTPRSRHEFALAARSAGSAREVKRLLAEALHWSERHNADAYDFQAFQMVLQQAPRLSRGVVREAWRLGNSLTDILFEREDLGEVEARWLIERGMESLRRMMEWPSIVDVPLLESAYRHGWLRGDSPETEVLLEAVERLGEEREKQMQRQIPLEGLAETLLASPTLGEAALLRIWRAARPRPDSNLLPNLLAHPAGGPAFWREVSSSPVGILEMLAQIPAACQLPEVRTRLGEQAAESPERPLLALGLARAGGEGAAEHFRRLAELEPEWAAELLEEADFGGWDELGPADLLPLLSHPLPRVRLRAIVALPRLEGRQEGEREGQTAPPLRERLKRAHRWDERDLPF